MGYPPTIWPHVLPEDEREKGMAIRGNLSALEFCVANLRAAEALITEALGRCGPFSGVVDDPTTPEARARRANNRLMGQWMRIAARSGALSIYEFHMVAAAIDQLASECPTLDSWIDKDARKAASSFFKEFFPDFAAVRLFAAHGSEMLDKPNKLKKHSISFGSNSEITLGDLLGRKSINTFNGKVVSYELTPQTVNNLEQVLIQRWKSVEPFADASRRQSAPDKPGNLPPRE